MTFILTLFVAAAEPACEPPSLSASQPAEGATDVPTRVAILGAFKGDCGSGEVMLTVTDPDGTVVLDEAFDLANATGSTERLLESMPVDLLPETAYEARFEGETITSWSFTTGSTTAAPLEPSTISLTVGNAVGFTEDQVHFVEANATVEAPAGHPAIIRADGRELGFLASVPGVVPVSVVAPAGEFCLEAAVRQFDGEWVVSAEQCVTPTESSGAEGCSTNPGRGSWALLLLAVPLFARRRAPRA